ncbi:hypothetical protein [uncultured Pelagimonas sp.]|uniref:hypothetical protein n=1 Tax=uncultured Pelagimonas sp. TaxID=1618102 RepID=UPI00260B9818|nr:hypothetical protein [uncultured Pelagimonas sp.]
MSGLDLKADCSRCAALCCMAFEFEPSPDFAISKPAGAGCTHLNAEFGCKIHADRLAKGFAGCLKFDCLGAGQRVSQDVFKGADWRVDPTLGPRMIEAFRILREVHRLYELLDVAGRLPLAADQERQRQDLIARLDPETAWTEPDLLRLDERALHSAVTGFLSALKDVVKTGATQG